MVRKRLRKFLERWQKPHKPSEVEVKRQRDLGADYEETMMAVTFAEANEAETAREILNEQNQIRPESRTRKQEEKRPELRV